MGVSWGCRVLHSGLRHEAKDSDYRVPRASMASNMVLGLRKLNQKCRCSTPVHEGSQGPESECWVPRVGVSHC